MKLIKNITLLFTASFLILSCGDKEASKLCTGIGRKEYKDAVLSATVENGCVIKYEKPNEYKIDGDVTIVINGDSASVKNNIKLKKGTLISAHGEFVVKQQGDELKIRLITGEGAMKVGEKEVTLEKYKVLSLGSK
jgi:hypothetical protein